MNLTAPGFYNNYTGLLSTLPAGLKVDWRASSPGDRIRIITTTAIPEPTSLFLFAAGLAGAGFGARRRSRR